MADEDYEAWSGFQATSLTDLTPDNLDPDIEYEIQIRAITPDFVASDWTDSIFFTTPADDVAPATPSAPIISSKMGAFTIVWDGHTSSGGTMAPDFERVDIYANGNLVGTQRVAGAEFVWQSAAYGVSYAITFVAVDRGGNSSAASAATTGTVTKVVSTDLGSGSVGGSALIDGSITTIKIGDSQIIAGKIATGAITTTKITDGAISTPKLSTGAVIADKIAANAVTVDKLAAASVTTDKLRVGAASNAIADPNFLSATINALRLGPTKWTVVTGNRAKSSTVVAGERMWLIGDLAYATTTADGVALTANLLPVKEGETYYESVNFFSSTSGFSVSLLTLVYDATGARVGTNFSTATPISGTTAVSTAYTIPSGGCFIAVAIQFSAAGGDAISVWAPKVWQQTPGVLIESGAVTADKIAANAIEAGKIKAGAIDGMTISGATISGGVFKSTARTADNDTGKSGWWIQSDGYANVKGSGGSTIFEINPSSNFVRVGTPGTGSMTFDAAGGGLQINGQYLGLSSLTGGLKFSIIADADDVSLESEDGGLFLTAQTIAQLRSSGKAQIRSGGSRLDMGYTTSEADFMLCYGGSVSGDPGNPTQAGSTGSPDAMMGFHPTYGMYIQGGYTYKATMQGTEAQLRASNNTDATTRATVHELRLDWSSTTPRMIAKTVVGQTTTGGSPVVISSGGVFLVSSSARKTKLDIQSHDFGDSILDVDPKTFFDRSSVEGYAEKLSEVDGDMTRLSDDDLAHINTLRRLPGLIAEEVEDIGLGDFVHYSDAGEVTGLMYDRLWVPLIPIIREQRDKITDLETRLAALEGR